MAQGESGDSYTGVRRSIRESGEAVHESGGSKHESCDSIRESGDSSRELGEFERESVESKHESSVYIRRCLHSFEASWLRFNPQ